MIEKSRVHVVSFTWFGIGQMQARGDIGDSSVESLTAEHLSKFQGLDFWCVTSILVVSLCTRG